MVGANIAILACPDLVPLGVDGLVIVGATAWDEGLDVGLRDYA